MALSGGGQPGPIALAPGAAGPAVGGRAARDDGARSAHAQTDSRLVLLAALRKLPFEQREALALHYLADLPLADIAARVGAPLGTVKARLSRGRDALGRLLADDVVKEGGRDV